MKGRKLVVAELEARGLPAKTGYCGKHKVLRQRLVEALLAEAEELAAQPERDRKQLQLQLAAGQTVGQLKARIEEGALREKDQALPADQPLLTVAGKYRGRR